MPYYYYYHYHHHHHHHHLWWYSRGGGGCVAELVYSSGTIAVTDTDSIVSICVVGMNDGLQPGLPPNHQRCSVVLAADNTA